MTTRLEREVRFLKLYAAGSTLLFLLLFLGAFQGARQRQRFTEIDVERINVVEADGRPVVVIANQARLPGNVMNGREYSDREGIGGLIFYNGEGDEAGGLVFRSERGDTSVTAFGQLSLDRFESDQVVTLNYTEQPGYWGAGLHVSHLPRHLLIEWSLAQDSINRLPEAERPAAMRALRRRFFTAGKWEIKRVFVGEEGRTAEVRVHDTAGRPRIRMVVDSLDVARLEFIDADGKVVSRLPAM
ncbi:MAG TPA: hypothetical protein VF746_11745 [Longimicrobium sp.]|jgi:hypothetical protein